MERTILVYNRGSFLPQCRTPVTLTWAGGTLQTITDPWGQVALLPTQSVPREFRVTWANPADPRSAELLYTEISESSPPLFFFCCWDSSGNQPFVLKHNLENQAENVERLMGETLKELSSNAGTTMSSGEQWAIQMAEMAEMAAGVAARVGGAAAGAAGVTAGAVATPITLAAVGALILAGMMLRGTSPSPQNTQNTHTTETLVPGLPLEQSCFVTLYLSHVNPGNLGLLALFSQFLGSIFSFLGSSSSHKSCSLHMPYLTVSPTVSRGNNNILDFCMTCLGFSSSLTAFVPRSSSREQSFSLNLNLSLSDEFPTAFGQLPSGSSSSSSSAHSSSSTSDMEWLLSLGALALLPPETTNILINHQPAKTYLQQKFSQVFPFHCAGLSLKDLDRGGDLLKPGTLSRPVDIFVVSWWLTHYHKGTKIPDSTTSFLVPLARHFKALCHLQNTEISSETMIDATFASPSYLTSVIASAGQVYPEVWQDYQRFIGQANQDGAPPKEASKLLPQAAALLANNDLAPYPNCVRALTQGIEALLSPLNTSLQEAEWPLWVSLAYYENVWMIEKRIQAERLFSSAQKIATTGDEMQERAAELEKNLEQWRYGATERK